MIIAFMGNDGSGKTTIGKKIYEKFKEIGFDVEYREEFNYFLIKYIFKFVSKSQIEKKRQSFTKNNKKKPFVYNIWPLLIWFDCLIEYIYLKSIKKNKIIITDRYAYDFLMSWTYLGYLNKIYECMYKLFPRPDMPVIFEVEPEIAYARKKDTHIYEFEFYIVQRNRYIEFSNKMKIPCLNTNEELNITLKKIQKLFFTEYMRNNRKEDILLLQYSSLDGYEYIGPQVDLSDNLDWDYITDMAVKNNVEYILYKNILNNKLPEDLKDHVKYILSIDKKALKKYYTTLKIIKQSFDKEGIEFILIKTESLYPSVPTDIDILVKKSDIETAKRVLDQLYSQKITPHIHKAETYKSKNLMPIDLHYEISWLGIKALDESIIWSRKRKISINEMNYFIPSMEDELLILTAHSIFQHHYFTLGEIYSIGIILSNEIDLEYIFKHAEYFDWKIKLSFALGIVSAKHALYAKNLMYYENRIFNNKQFNPVFFHPLKLISKNNYQQFIDYILFYYRKMKYIISGTLPYNLNWMDEYE